MSNYQRVYLTCFLKGQVPLHLSMTNPDKPDPAPNPEYPWVPGSLTIRSRPKRLSLKEMQIAFEKPCK